MLNTLQVAPSVSSLKVNFSNADSIPFMALILIMEKGFM